MESMSEARRIAHQLCAQYEELEFEDTFAKLNSMTINEFRDWKDKLQTSKTKKTLYG